MEIEISASFKKNVSRSILAVTLFILVFNVLVILGFAFAALCGLLAVAIVFINSSLILIIVALGLVLCGFLTVAFLLKFLFASKPRSQPEIRLEIDRTDAPVLYELIDNLVTQIGTKPPKKVFISTGVNAAVFYESRLKSLFFPSRKNLDIGMGLICCTTAEELRAVLAHEFGHFAQKSMILGSYVSSLNAIIYNQLYNNDSYNSLAESLSKIHAIVGFFVGIARVIVSGIQKLMIKGYELLNVQYLALSRDMEFNADEVAVNVAGKGPFIDCLSRLTYADSALAEVYSFYENQKEPLRIPSNIYPQFQAVLLFLTNKHQLKLKNGLPVIEDADRERYGKSKLNIEDQWATHPALEDRVKHISNLNVGTAEGDRTLSTSLFADIESVQHQLTEELFKGFGEEERLSLGQNDFEKEYEQFYIDRNFSDIFNNYYSDKTPIFRITESVGECQEEASELFSDEAVSVVYEDIFLEGDIQVLQAIEDKRVKVKFFEYDNERYSRTEVTSLLSKLYKYQQGLADQINKQDEKIATCLLSKSMKAGVIDEFKSKAEVMNRYFDSYPEVNTLINECYQRTAFFAETTEFMYITKYIKHWKEKERELQLKIKDLLDNPAFIKTLGSDLSEDFRLFAKTNYSYFDGESIYFEDEVKHLFSVLNNFPGAFEVAFFETKKDMLHFMEGLLTTVTNEPVAA